LFGLTAQQVAESRGWYNPNWHYENEPETQAALDLIASDYFSQSERGAFAPLLDMLLKHGDHFMHLADLTACLRADHALCALYAEPSAWAQGILNVAGSGNWR
jgi:starch phosphorylase